MAGYTQWFYEVFVAEFDIWIALGFLAQGVFTMRFGVQWLASERAGRSVVPVSFWFLSVVGGSLLFVYALVRRDPVFIVGQGFGLLIYLRNLRLIYLEKRSALANTQ
jgi:lipid-A-disaccharide synthase-like uncharacterized protein